jgi:hypothetical protein
MSVRPSPGERPAPAPPTAEEIHLPGPSILPLVSAIAITLIVVGTTLGWYLSAIGGIVLLIVVIRWVGDTRRDVAVLPERHE